MRILQPVHSRRRPASQVALARFATALAVVSVGAIAVGALAIGSLAIRRLALKDARILRLEIDELVVGRLRIRERIEANPEAPGQRN